MRWLASGGRPASARASATQKLNDEVAQPTKRSARTATRKSTAARCSGCSAASSPTSSRASLCACALAWPCRQAPAKPGSDSKMPDARYSGSPAASPAAWKASAYARSTAGRAAARARSGQPHGAPADRRGGGYSTSSLSLTSFTALQCGSLGSLPSYAWCATRIARRARTRRSDVKVILDAQVRAVEGARARALQQAGGRRVRQQLQRVAEAHAAGDVGVQLAALAQRGVQQPHDGHADRQGLLRALLRRGPAPGQLRGHMVAQVDADVGKVAVRREEVQAAQPERGVLSLGAHQEAHSMAWRPGRAVRRRALWPTCPPEAAQAHLVERLPALSRSTAC